jgi:hypothetical protein
VPSILFVTNGNAQTNFVNTTGNNGGIQYAVYTGTANVPYNSDSTYSNFNPAKYKTLTPYTTGTNIQVGPVNYTGANSVDMTIYGNPNKFKTDYFAVNHRGYIYARESGTYAFQSDFPDDIVMVWVGPNAYRGYTNDKGNYILRNPYGAGKTIATVDLKQGQYYPVRVIYANAQQAAQLHFEVRSPGGTAIIDSEGNVNTQYLVQFSCDNIAAPKYDPWGQEK